MAWNAQDRKGCFGFIMVVLLVYCIARAFGCGGPETKVSGNEAVIKFDAGGGAKGHKTPMVELGNEVYYTFKKNPTLKKITCKINSECVDSYGHNSSSEATFTLGEEEIKNLEILRYTDGQTFGNSDMWLLTSRTLWYPCGNSALSD